MYIERIIKIAEKRNNTKNNVRDQLVFRMKLNLSPKFYKLSIVVILMNGISEFVWII